MESLFQLWMYCMYGDEICVLLPTLLVIIFGVGWSCRTMPRASLLVVGLVFGCHILTHHISSCRWVVHPTSLRALRTGNSCSPLLNAHCSLLIRFRMFVLGSWWMTDSSQLAFYRYVTTTECLYLLVIIEKKIFYILM